MLQMFVAARAWRVDQFALGLGLPVAEQLANVRLQSFPIELSRYADDRAGWKVVALDELGDIVV